MTTLRPYWLSLLLLALNMVLLVVTYDRLPDPVPTLWDDNGVIIDWMFKPMGAVLLPVMHLITILVLIICPLVVPGGIGAHNSPRIYPLILAILSGILLFATSLVFAQAMGSAFSLPQTMLGGIGVLLALVGNYLGKLPKNYVFGIRTPWTLSSDHVWERTHRLAGRVFVAGGTTLFLYCVVQRGFLNSALISAIILGTVLTPCIYSYLVWVRATPEDQARFRSS
jgi:uncharacterized membrane protein